MRFRAANLPIICLFLLLAAGCSNTRYLQEGETLLNRNDIHLKPAKGESLINARELADQLSGLCKQKPNTRKLFFFRIPLWLHNKFLPKHEKITRLNNWILLNLGEDPAVFDSSLVDVTANQMRIYLMNNGYLHNRVTYSYKTKRKRTNVLYSIETGRKYLLGSIHWPSDSTPIGSLLKDNTDGTLLHTGELFSVNRIQQEQSRLVSIIQNAGYYHFNSDYIKFDADSLHHNDTVNLYVRVLNPAPRHTHALYYIRHVYVFSNQDELASNAPKEDTTVYQGMNFICDSVIILPRVLSEAIFIKPGNTYSRKDYSNTIYRITDLGIYKFISIQFVETGDNRLDCIIRLIRAKKRRFSLDSDVNNIENNLEVSGKVSYTNKNLYRRAIVSALNLNIGSEIPVFRKDSLLFNVDVTASITLPQFVGYPGRSSRLSQYANPKTRFSVGYSLLQQSSVYSLSTYNGSFGWEFNETAREGVTKKWIINWASLSLVVPSNLNPLFVEKLNNDPILKQSFSEQFIPAGNVAFVHTTSPAPRRPHYSYFKASAEISGVVSNFIIWDIVLPLGGSVRQDDAGHYKILNQTFSNYGKLEFDYRQYRLLGGKRSLNFRVNMGFGKVGGLQIGNTHLELFPNSNALPYVKQFYVGGSNSIRAWRPRALGPGSFSAYGGKNNLNIFYNQTGDIKMEGNAEFRFGLGGYFRGAVFVDAGNIWLAKLDTSKPGGEFLLNQFYKQIAVGTGVGLRMDFSFLILRLDVGLPVYDPARALGMRFITSDFRPLAGSWRNDNLVLNLAVGYPF